MIQYDRTKTDSLLIPQQQEEPSVVDRMLYLLPNRYFRFFLLYNKRKHQSCWIPEGFSR